MPRLSAVMEAASTCGDDDDDDDDAEGDPPCGPSRMGVNQVGSSIRRLVIDTMSS